MSLVKARLGVKWGWDNVAHDAIKYAITNFVIKYAIANDVINKLIDFLFPDGYWWGGLGLGVIY